VPKFTYDNILKVRDTAKAAERRGEKAWVVGVIDDRARYPLEKFPPGVVYTVEFEDGEAIDIHEDDLDATNE
jgi:hypothetical protein